MLSTSEKAGNLKSESVASPFPKADVRTLDPEEDVDIPIAPDWGDGDSWASPNPSDSLVGALWASLMVEHVFLPLFHGGACAARACIRLLASLFAATAVSAAVFSLNPDAHEASRVIIVSLVPWALIELEGVAQYLMRRRSLQANRVSSFSADDLCEATWESAWDVSCKSESNLALFGPIELHDDEMDNSPAKRNIGIMGQNVSPQGMVHDCGALASPASVPSRFLPAAPQSNLVAALPLRAPSRLPPITVASHTIPPQSSVGQRRTPRSSQQMKVGQNPPPAPRFPPPLSSIGLAKVMAHRAQRPVGKLAGDVQSTIVDFLGHSRSSFEASSVSALSETRSDTRSISTAEKTFSANSCSSATSISECTKSAGTRSNVSILSVSCNGPKVHVKQPINLETLKNRYINEITGTNKVVGDQRLDCGDVTFTIEALDGMRPSLRLSCVALATAWAGLASAFGIWGPELFEAGHLGSVFTEAIVGWLFAVLALDLILVSSIVGVQWHALQSQLAARLDRRWQRIEQQSAQKRGAMRLAARDQVIKSVPSDKLTGDNEGLQLVKFSAVPSASILPA